MRADYINPVLHSVMETLAGITHHDPCPGRVKLKKHELAPGVVTGLVNLQINDQKGSLALSFSRDLILNIASEITHHVQRRIDGTVLNLAGRLTYMACNGARQHFNDPEAVFMLTTPQVFQGFRHRVHHPLNDPKFMMQFETPCGICFSEFSFSQLQDEYQLRY